VVLKLEDFQRPFTPIFKTFKALFCFHELSGSRRNGHFFSRTFTDVRPPWRSLNQVRLHDDRSHQQCRARSVGRRVLDEQHLGFLKQQAEVGKPLRTDRTVHDSMITAQSYTHDARRAVPNTTHTNRHTQWSIDWLSCGFTSHAKQNRGPIYKISYDNLTIMPKLRSTYDGRLICKTSYEERKDFLMCNSLAKS